MVRVALILLLAFCAWLVLRLLLQDKPVSKGQFNAIYLALLAGIGLVWLGLTGRLNPLFSLVGAVLPLMARYGPLAMKLLGVRRFWASARKPGNTPASSDMTVKEALAVLGLSAGASREEIVDAHRRLIQRMHPDRGGSDWLAARINTAKSVLLAEIDT